jgi:hypothetical protein
MLAGQITWCSVARLGLAISLLTTQDEGSPTRGRLGLQNIHSFDWISSAPTMKLDPAFCTYTHILYPIRPLMFRQMDHGAFACPSSLASRRCQAHLTASATIAAAAPHHHPWATKAPPQPRRRRPPYARVSGMHAEASLPAYINPTMPPTQDLFTPAPSSRIHRALFSSSNRRALAPLRCAVVLGVVDPTASAAPSSPPGSRPVQSTYVAVDPSLQQAVYNRRPGLHVCRPPAERTSWPREEHVDMKDHTAPQHIRRVLSRARHRSSWVSTPSFSHLFVFLLFCWSMPLASPMAWSPIYFLCSVPADYHESPLPPVSSASAALLLLPSAHRVACQTFLSRAKPATYKHGQQ